MVMLEQAAQRVPSVSFLDANSIEHAGPLALRQHVVVDDLLVVSETDDITHRSETAGRSILFVRNKSRKNSQCRAT